MTEKHWDRLLGTVMAISLLAALIALLDVLRVAINIHRLTSE